MLLGALSAWVLLVVVGWARGSLPRAGVIIAISITIFAAVSTPSNQSRDVYSYAMYGRIVTEYHENPFSNYPVHFEGDPIRPHVGTMWQRTPDIYGPAFTAIMAGLAPINGASTFRVRFSYQLVSAAAMGAILWLLWRRTRSALVLAFAGLHPLVAVSVVNGGHPDALVALGVLLGVLLAMERRVVLAALALAFATAINFTTITVAVAIGVWAWRRWSHRELFRFGAITLGLGALPYLFLGGWLKNAHDHAKLISRQSVWRIVDSLTGLRAHIPNGTTLLLGALMAVVLWRQTRRATPEAAAAAAIVVFVVASPWVMPWYGFAALPDPRVAQAEPADVGCRALRRVDSRRRSVPVAHPGRRRRPPAPDLAGLGTDSRARRVRDCRVESAARARSYGATNAVSIGLNFACVSAHSASGSDPATIPAPACSNACAPVISAPRNATTNAPSPRASTQPNGPA